MVPTDAGVELGVGNQSSGIAKSISNACPMAEYQWLESHPPVDVISMVQVVL